MPLRLFPPRAGRSPNWTIRGTYLKIRINQSAGTSRKAVALGIKSKIERAIECGEYNAPEPRQNERTFVSAAADYMQATGNTKHIAALIEHFGFTPLDEIDQRAIDQAALTLKPNVSPATRNRSIYTPVAAVLHHAGSKVAVRRPKGAKGKVRTDSMTIEDATGIIAAAKQFDPEFATLLSFLLYTGCRLGECVDMIWEHVDLERRTAYIPDSKNGDPRAMLLRPEVIEGLAALRPEKAVGRVFRFKQGGNLKLKLVRARLAVCGLPMPKRGVKPPPHRLGFVKFHTFRHTWATWMRRYAGVDVQGLVATGNWRDVRSASRYSHVTPRDEWEKVAQLPALKSV
jgi:integrase